VNSYHFQDLEGMTVCEAPYDVRGVVNTDELSTGPDRIIWTLDGIDQSEAKNKLTWKIQNLNDGPHTITMTVYGKSNIQETISSAFVVHCTEIGNIIPDEQDVCMGEAVAMSTDIDLTNETYQWQSSPNGITWTNITGETRKDYSIVNQKRGLTYYRVIVTDGNKTVNSNPARVRIRSCSLPVNHNMSVMEY